MPESEMKSFEEFWPFYVREHSRPGTRALHAVGTLVGTSLFGALALAAPRARARLRRRVGRPLLRRAQPSGHLQAPALVARRRLQDGRVDARRTHERRGR